MTHHDLADSYINSYQAASTIPLTKQQKDFLTCLMTALFDALPCFLDSLIACLTGAPPDGGPDNYNPGTRERCA